MTFRLVCAIKFGILTTMHHLLSLQGQVVGNHLVLGLNVGGWKSYKAGAIPFKGLITAEEFDNILKYQNERFDGIPFEALEIQTDGNEVVVDVCRASEHQTLFKGTLESFNNSEHHFDN